MQILFGLLLTLSLLAVAPGALAETYRREVSFEWEEVPNAKSYEVEIRAVTNDGTNGKTINFKTRDAIWTGKLVPGKYMMSLRSRDLRGVPGEWSLPSEFNVNLDPVKVKSPAANAQIKSDETEEITQKFEWEPVQGAQQYQFELTSEDGKIHKVETIQGLDYKVEIPVAKTYTWKITGLGDKEIKSDSVTVSEFTVVGKKIPAPTIKAPESEFVREITWARPEHVENYDLNLNRINPATKKWEKVLTQENVTGETFNFEQKHPGGIYRLEIKAKGTKRQASDTAKINFKVIDGNRSPAAEYNALVRKSIDRLTGWYAIASYLITKVNYHGESLENNSRTTDNILGGTGRVGAGYFDPSGKWGFVGIADMSGFIMYGSNHTYSSIELNGISRHVVGDLGEGRFIGGIYYKEIPQLIGIPVSGSNGTVEFSQTAVAGPHFGAEYWHSLSPKLGFQVNAHFYYSLMTIKTPNGNDSDPRMSYQVGLMGSYRVSKRFTGLMGLTQKVDQVAYKVQQTGNPTQAPGSFNSTRITGQYLSFFAEYGF